MSRRTIASNVLFDHAVEALGEGSEVEVPTKGSSMLPFIVGERDTLVLEPLRRVVVGDIVMAKIKGHYIIHRIMVVDERTSQVTLMGDGNIIGREFCTVGDLKARVKYIVRGKKIVDCNSRHQRRLAALWRFILPVRRYIMGVWRRTPFWPYKKQK